MTFDPTDPSLQRRPPRPRPQLYRRDVLRGGLWLTVGMGAAPLLAACSDNGGTSSTGDYPLARPDSPVDLPINDSNPAIADGLPLESGGVFKILNYDQYMAPGLMKDFGERYGVEVQVTPYNNYDEMLTRITATGQNFDLVFPGPSVMSRMVYNELIQPLNHSYVGNLKNTWPEYQDPWYDLGAKYSVPYTVYTTGVGYRADVVTPPDNGYMMIWEADPGRVGLLDDAGESLGMAMLAWDITRDINTSDQAHIDAARDKLIELIPLKVETTVSAYQRIPNGDFDVHQCWSGDMIAGQYYLADDITVQDLGYWVPESPADRVIGNDNICIPKSAEKPVLAHRMINELLDNKISLRNFWWNGYQPPITKLSADYLIDIKAIPENLLTTVVVPEDFETGLTFYETSPAVLNQWLTAYEEFQSG